VSLIPTSKKTKIFPNFADVIDTGYASFDVINGTSDA
jgi:hypothetical protein